MLSLCCLLQSGPALGDTSESVQNSVVEAKQDVEKQEGEQEFADKIATPKWKTPLEEGSDQLFYFVQAVSGKKLKPVTYELLKGVDLITIEKQRIVFRRCDNAELEISDSTEGGAKFFVDWEKSKVNLEDKFGKSGKEFLENITAVQVKDGRIEIIRNGPDDLLVELGDRKIHPAFDLRAIRFKQISMHVHTDKDLSYLEDIRGVTAVIKAPGFTFPVDVKEFSKKRLEKENDIRVGVRNPVPGPLRTLLLMPQIFHFRFRLMRKVT